MLTFSFIENIFLNVNIRMLLTVMLLLLPAQVSSWLYQLISMIYPLNFQRSTFTIFSHQLPEKKGKKNETPAANLLSYCPRRNTCVFQRLHGVPRFRVVITVVVISSYVYDFVLFLNKELL